MPVVHEKLFYGGAWNTPSPSGGVIDVFSASTEEAIGSVPEAAERDVDLAVSAARAAFDDPSGWATWLPGKRAEVLEAFAAALDARTEELAHLVSAQNGMPIKQSRVAEAATGPHLLRYYAGITRERDTEGLRGSPERPSSLVRSEPLGVVAAIVPWNFPSAIAFMKLAPMLAAGCTAVWKPARETVLDAFLVAECALEAGLPPGVLNIVPGGRELGAYLVGHPGIDKVTFTGSTAGGRSVAARCGELLRPVSLELGGKSAAIVLDDADLADLRDEFLYATMNNGGQTCWLSTRILVPSHREAEMADLITDMVRSQVVGDALDETTDIGPMVSSAHRDRVEGYIAAGVRDGAQVTTGGGRVTGRDRGWFVEPTVLRDVRNDSVVAREEIFGPVLCVIPYSDIDDAVAQANDSEYGLGGSVWTADDARGLDVARRVRTGTMGINSYIVDLGAPFGGVKASGLGRELGPEAITSYETVKSVYPHPTRAWRIPG